MSKEQIGWPATHPALIAQHFFMTWTQTHQRLFVALCAAYFLLGLLYAWATPPLEASDEYKHYPVVQYMQTTGQLPVLDPADPGLWSNEAAQPPLYYAIMALATLPFDTSDLEQLHQINTHFFVGNPHQIHNKNIMLPQPELSGVTQSGTMQAMYLIRLLGLGLGLGTIWLTAVLGRKFLPATPALAAAGLVAFNPMFIFLTASVNNDTLALFLGAAGTILLVETWRNPPDPRREWPRYALLGLLCGLALLTKMSLAALLLLAGILLAIRAWQTGRWSLLFGGGLLTFGVAMALWLPWLARNFALYGDILAMNVFIETMGTRPNPTFAGVAWLAEFGTFYRNYWGQFGGVNIGAPEWYYNLASGLFILGLLGWLGRIGRDASKQDDQAIAAWGRRFISSGAWLLVILPLILFVLLVRWTIIYYSFQGRLIFPALAAINVLWAGGLWQWAELARRGHTAVVTLPVTFFGLMAFLLPIFIIQPNYQLPEPLTAVADPHQFGPIRFQASDGHTLNLVGVATEAELPSTLVGDPQGVEITLYWTIDAPTSKNYVTSVHALGRELTSVGQSDRYPGWGLWPTSRWQLGEIYEDRYRVQVQPGAIAPSRLQFSVGVLEPFDETATPTTAANTAVMTALAPDGTEIPLVIVGEARLVASQAPPPPRELFPVLLEDGIRFVGYELNYKGADTAVVGQTLDVTLQWQAISTPSQDYTIFFQILDSDKNYIAGADSPPLNGDFPTRLWREGDIITETRSLILPPDLSPGAYHISLGLYDPTTGARVPLVGGRGTDNISWGITITDGE